MKIRALVIFFMFSGFFAFAADSTGQSAVNTEQAREDYKLFLKKLKELNSQYKQVTGQMAQVIKEEGVPSWDNGDLDKKIKEIFPDHQSAQEGVRIKESENGLSVAIDMPGIKKDSIKITVLEGTKLTVSANLKAEENTAPVVKAVILPKPVDPTGAKANYEDGVINIEFIKLPSQEVSIPLQTNTRSK